MDDSYRLVLTKLTTFMEDHSVPGHDMEHFLAVVNHVDEALKSELLDESTSQLVRLAALLHDVDDSKLFPDHHDNENARHLLQDILNDEDTDKVLHMIDLVSCSHGGNSDVENPYMALPRDADRLEAIGKIGIERCRSYTEHKKAPRHTDETPRVYSSDELWKVATDDRFKHYTTGVKSESEIDHYYDKLLHIGKSRNLKSKNVYILAEAERRNQIMIDYVLDYWKNVK